MDVTSISSRGQVVIPQKLRDRLGLHSGEKFIVLGENDTVILKRIATPSKEHLIKELEVIAKEGKKRLQSKGIKEADIPKIVEKSRAK